MFPVPHVLLTRKTVIILIYDQQKLTVKYYYIHQCKFKTYQLYFIRNTFHLLYIVHCRYIIYISAVMNIRIYCISIYFQNYF